jgi:hypothetical protein
LHLDRRGDPSRHHQGAGHHPANSIGHDTSTGPELPAATAGTSAADTASDDNRQLKRLAMSGRHLLWHDVSLPND